MTSTYQIPPVLYRGDADKNNDRQLKSTLHLNQLQTNMIGGGIGHVIFRTPITELVMRHVHHGWNKTHFLSFSEDKTTAFRFGMGCRYDEVQPLLENVQEYFDDGPGWTFVVIAIDTTRITWKEIGAGIYHGHYVPDHRKFAIFPGSAKAILMDVARVVSAYPDHPDYIEVLTKATRDKEWLLLPASEMQMNNGAIEYSGIMDGGCFHQIEKFKRPE